MKRLVALACLYPLPSMAAPLPREGVFVYSNLCWEAGSGDPAGYRLKIERAPGGDSLYFEWSEGGLMGAQAAKLTIEPQTGALDSRSCQMGRRRISNLPIAMWAGFSLRK